MSSGCATNESSSSSFDNLLDLKEEQVKGILEVNHNDRGRESYTVKKFRVLLSMRTLESRQLRNERILYSPAQAPLAEIAAPAQSPVSSGVWNHIAPANSLKPKRENGAKPSRERLIIAIVASIGIAFVVVSSAIVACKRCRRNKRSEKLVPLSSRRSKFLLPSTATNKVCFDPGPEQFYLDSLTSYLESDLRKQTFETKDISSDGSISYRESDISIKQILDYKNAFANGIVSNVVLPNGESMEYESDMLSSPEMEKITIEDQNSDNESLHSRCSQSTDQSFVEEPEEDFCKGYKNSSLSDEEIFTSQHLASRATCDTESSDEKNSKCSSNLDSVSTKQIPNGPNHSAEKATMLMPSVCQIKPPSKPLPPPHVPPTKLPMPSTLPPSMPPPPPPPPLPPVKLPSLPVERNHGKTPPQPATPIGKDGTPLPKLKPLHWVKVRASPDRSMVWDRIRTSSFEFDEKMIESLFGYNSQSSARLAEVRNKSLSSGNSVMEHKRLQNITILMKALNTSTEKVFHALTQGKGLSVQQLEALVRMTPTKEEEEKLFMYEGDIDDLEPAEKFLEMILRIPFAFARSELMLYRETFQDEVDHLRKSFEMLDEACKELRSSRLFLRLLEAVLKTGNRMNVGTIRGGARAFKLDALLKLGDVKGTDGKTTLLHFVVQEMIRSEGVKSTEATEQESEEAKPISVEEKEDDFRAIGLKLMSGLSNELSNVKKTASIDLDVLASSVTNLSNGLSQLKHLILDLSSDSRNDDFRTTMEYFIGNAETAIKELKDEEELVLLHVREITEYYYGDVSVEEANPLRIFVIVRDFLAMLDRACKEVRGSKSPHGTFPIVPFR